MAPAVTSDTAPCTRTPHLCTSLPTSPLNADSAEVCETVAMMSAPNSQDTDMDVDVKDEATAFHPFACVPSIGLGHPVPVSAECSGRAPDTVNGVGVNSAQVGTPVNLQNARIVNLKNTQQMLNIVIKNNGACSSNVLPSAVGSLGETGHAGMPSVTCNGGGTSSNVILCSRTATFLPSQACRPDAVKLNSILAVASPVYRMLITPRVPAPVLQPSVPSLPTVTVGCDHAGGSNGLRLERESVRRDGDEICTDISSPVDSDRIIPADKTSLDGVVSRQQKLVSRASLILRRLRRLQSRQANSSVRQQLIGLVSALKRIKREAESADSLESKSTQDFKSMSTSELVGLVRRMQSSDAAKSQDARTDGFFPDLSVCPRLAETAGHLSSNLRHLESAVDSDATESSSGGESDDEPSQDAVNSEDYIVVSESTDRMQAKLSWASERAMIASRWTWLQAQVSDLEYRIRQQSDIYRQLRALKGPVSFHDQCSTSQASMNNQHPAPVCRKTILDDSASECHSSAESEETSLSSIPGATLHAARCRAVRNCRRRRLVRLVGNARLLANRRTTPQSTVGCTSCYPPATPCALCINRTNSVVSLNSDLPLLEKVAHLDPAFHPVLSFPPDIQLSTRLADCVRQTALGSDFVAVSESSAVGGRGLTIKISKANLKSSLSSLTLKNQHGCELSRQPSSVVGPDGDRVATSSNNHLMAMKSFRSHLNARRTVDAWRYRKRYVKRLGRASGTGLKPGRPPRLSQSASSASLRDTLKRQSSSVFDINNVVIPYGASTTRIEKLEYKEILTPRWREVPKTQPLSGRKSSVSATVGRRLKRDSTSHIQSPLPPEVSEDIGSSSSNNLPAGGVGSSGTDSCHTDNEIEDLSDETFAARHLRYEIYEKKQCLPLMNQRRRSRSNRSESDQSLTLTANARSPEASLSEGFGDSSSQFVFHSFVEPVRPSESVTFHLHEQMSPQLVDSHIRQSSSTSSFSLSASVFDNSHVEALSEVTARSWPQRSFPLDDAEFEQLHVDIPAAPINTRHFPVFAAAPASSSHYVSAPSETSISTVTDTEDPEWTVVAQQKTADSDGSGFCLKIAKI